VHFTAPPAFGGLEGRWTPEDLLLGAVASCYTTTFQAVAGYSNLEYMDLEVAVEATVCKQASGYGIERIVIRPKVAITDEEGERHALDVMKKAKSLCLVSRALGVDEEFDPAVEVVKAVPVA
jgi:organic hydroperoxide reductase OsmC/OhrA